MAAAVVSGRSSLAPMDGHRTLADQFRSWPDQRLARLLRDRPDLATPAPHDSAHLASRTATRSSLTRALDRLNRFELTVLDALVVAGQTTPDRLASLVFADPGAVTAALERLVDLAVAWEAPGGVRPLTGVAECLTGGPAAGVSGVKPLAGETWRTSRGRSRWRAGWPRSPRRPAPCSSTSTRRAGPAARERPSPAYVPARP